MLTKERKFYMHILSCSNRFYYDEHDPSVRKLIKEDVEIYSSMLRTSFKMWYDHSVKKVPFPLDDYGKELSLQTIIKKRYETSDYLPLSAINEAKGLLHARQENINNVKKSHKARIKKINQKLTSTKNKLKKLVLEKNRLITKSKKKQYTKEDYLYEVQNVDPDIRHLKSRIGLLTFKKNRFQDKLKKLEVLPSIHFHKRDRMLIPGRRQGKYSNNLFKLNILTDEMLIRTTGGNITLPIQFHKNKRYLYQKVALPHNTPGKAVAYELRDYGEYFIIKAIMDIPAPECISYRVNGCISIDTNIDHFALTELDHHGNIVDTEIIPFKWKKRSTNQRKHDLRECAVKIVNKCIDTNKPLVMESLDFEGKRNSMHYENSKQNQKLSSFAYSQIMEIMERRAVFKGIECIKVDPSYTSQTGRKKYMKLKGLSVHMAASLVIGRRGLGFKDKLN